MKRIIFLLLLFLSCIYSYGTTYYVANEGNNSAAGTSPGASWQTIDKVNASFISGLIKINDTVVFKRSQLFFGTLRINKSFVVIKDFGVGDANPKLYGYQELTAWTNLGSNNFKASVNTLSYVNLVTLNGRPQTVARFPNLSATDGGYMTYEGGAKQTTNTAYIIDTDLTGSENWGGLEITVRTSDFHMDRGTITKQSGDTLFYTGNRSINNGVTPQVVAPQSGFGYFVMNSASFLNERGEWRYDNTAKEVTVNFGPGGIPTDNVVRIALRDTGIVCGNQSSIKIQNIDFEGYNLFSVFSFGSGISIINSTTWSNGARAIFTNNAANLTIDTMTIHNPLSTGIEGYNRGVNNSNYKNVVVKNAGSLPGMGSWGADPGDYMGMYVTVRSGLNIQYCTIDTSGYHGIKWQGSNVLIAYCEAKYFCLQFMDGGGIYTYIEGGRFYNRIVEYCITHHGIGNNYGTRSSEHRATGLYSDGMSMNTIYRYNTSYLNGKNGSHCNNCDSLSYIGNTYYGNVNNISFQVWRNYLGRKGLIKNLVITGNTSYLTDSAARHIRYTNDSISTSFESNLANLGTINNNRYNTLNQVGFTFEFYDINRVFFATNPYSLLGWQNISTQDANSSSIDQYTTYAVSSTIGSTKITNGNFTSGTGWSVAGTSTSFNYGSGFGTMTFGAPAVRVGSISQAVGGVSNSSKYLVRYKTTGTGLNGITAVYIRKQGSPFNLLTERQTQAFDTAGLWHEYLFQSPTTDAAASIVIEINQLSGTTRIDSVSMFEVNSTNNVLVDSVKFAANPTQNYINYILPPDYEYQQAYNQKQVKGTDIIIPYGSLLDIFFYRRPPTPSGSNRIYTPRRPVNVP